MAKILVTGGLGFIGSHTVVELANAGYEPVIVDNMANCHIRILDQLTSILGHKPEFHELELTDAAAVHAFVKSQGEISGLIHFAAYKAVGESVAEPLKYYQNNFYSLINLLDAFKDRDTHFVFSSSCTVYGQPDELPVTEHAAVKEAMSPYGYTKQAAEIILRDVAKANDHLKVIALRYFNPVGAHDSALIGELPIGVPQNLVPFITQTAIGKREKVTVFGTDYNTPDGSCIRDYIHVVDLAKAHVSALDRLKNGKQEEAYDVFNIGTGTGSSVLEVVNAFESSTGEKLNYVLGPRRPGDVEQVWGDVTKSTEQLGWKAEKNLSEMMSSAWAWEKYLKANPFD